MHAENKTPNTPTPLYSEVECDERGNFHYEGDLQQPDEDLKSLAGRVDRHLHAHFDGMRFSVTSERNGLGRTITAELLDAPDDLTGQDAQNDFTIRVRDQIERFGFTRSNFSQDSHVSAFFCDVRIGRPYWTAQAKRRGTGGSVEPLVSLAAFRKQLKPGDEMKLVDAPHGHRSLGATRTVKAVRSKDIVFEGPIYLGLPRVAQFACDGKLVEFAIGNEHQPDARLLYEWTPRKAA